MAKDPIKKTENGTYYFRANLGFHPITGKQIQKYKSGFKTKKEAREAYSKLMLTSTEELTEKKQQLSFQQFIEETYLPWYKTQVKESTYLNRRSTIQKHFSYFYKMTVDVSIGFDFASVSSHARIVNANRLQVHALAYNIFNWFRRFALSANMRKQRIDTVRLKLLKIAAKVIHSARYIIFKLCSSCPYKNEFYETLTNIRRLQIQLE